MLWGRLGGLPRCICAAWVFASVRLCRLGPPLGCFASLHLCRLGLASMHLCRRGFASMHLCHRGLCLGAWVPLVGPASTHLCRLWGLASMHLCRPGLCLDAFVPSWALPRDIGAACWTCLDASVPLWALPRGMGTACWFLPRCICAARGFCLEAFVPPVGSASMHWRLGVARRCFGAVLGVCLGAFVPPGCFASVHLCRLGPPLGCFASMHLCRLGLASMHLRRRGVASMHLCRRGLCLGAWVPLVGPASMHLCRLWGLASMHLCRPGPPPWAVLPRCTCAAWGLLRFVPPVGFASVPWCRALGPGLRA